MSTSNRAAKITKAHKVLKKHYTPYTVADRPILEQLLYACCLRSASHEAADEAFAKLQQAYYDWNEVRVTTISELAEVMSCLPRAAETASRLKRTLQSVFEAHYSFDLEGLKKENIGKAIKQLERLPGVSAFALAFVTQNGLNGHAIAVSDEALEVLRILGIVTDDEAGKKKVPGLERAVAKNRGVEFGSLLHQLGADCAAANFSSRVRAVLLEIAPDAKDRFPKRAGKKTAEEGEAPVKSEKTATTHQESDSKKVVSKPGDTKKKGPDKKETHPPELTKKPPAEDKKKVTLKKLTKKKPR
jgi:endonuclease-3